MLPVLTFLQLYKHLCTTKAEALSRDSETCKKAAEFYDKANSVENSLLCVFNKAIALSKTDDSEAAIRAFQDVFSVDPTNFQAHCGLASLFSGKDDHEHALEHLRQAITQAERKNSATATMYYNLGYSANELKRFDEAIAAFEKAIELDPELQAARNALEIVQLAKKQSAPLPQKAVARVVQELANEKDRDAAATQIQRIARGRLARKAVAGWGRYSDDEDVWWHNDLTGESSWTPPSVGGAR